MNLLLRSSKYYFVYCKLWFTKIIFILFLLPFSIQAQHKNLYEKGLPLIQNYFPKDYKADFQNWCTVQDHRGILYFANGNGVLEFDGEHWRIIKVGNDNAVSSLVVDDSGRIYVGSIAEFGYLAPSLNGELKYVSLIQKIDKKYRNFNFITKLFCVHNKIYFIANNKLFCWDHKTIKNWPLNKPSFCYSFSNELFVWQNHLGLKVLHNDTLKKIKGGELFYNKQIRNILPFDNTNMLVITRDSGMFLINTPSLKAKQGSPTIRKFPNQADNFLAVNNLIYSGMLNNGTYAFSTSRGGTAIMDKKGRLIQILNKSAGIKNITHYYIFQDNQHALWISTDNGITRADISSHLSFWNDNIGLDGTVLCVERFKNTIIAGTWQGLFYHHFSPENIQLDGEINTSNVSQFKMLHGINTTTWDIMLIENKNDSTKNKFLAATSNGVYEIDFSSSKLILKANSYKLYRYKKDPSLIFVSTSDGVKCISIKNTNNSYSFTYSGNINGIEERISDFEEDEKGRVWISTLLTSKYLVEFKNNDLQNIDQILANKTYCVSTFDTTSGLPEEAAILSKVKNKLLFISNSGIYYPVEKIINNTATIAFMRDNSFVSSIFKYGISISYLKEDTKGHLWVQLLNKNKEENILIEAIPLKNGYFSILVNPFKTIPKTEMYSIFPENNNVTWFGGDDGLFKYDGNMVVEYGEEFHSFIRKVVLERDSVLFMGAFCSNKNTLSDSCKLAFIQPLNQIPSIKHAYNSISFEYAAISYFDNKSKFYKVYLEGFDKKWSEWSNESKKEYTNLPPGTYRFHVVSKNIFDTLSTEAIYEFKILSPWYRTWFAFLIYILGFIIGVLFIIRYSNKRLRETKVKLEKIVNERTHEINKQKIELENEKEKSEKLLLNVLPFKVAQELKTNGFAKTKFFDQVSVLFSDFKDFTIIAQQLEHEELIAELNRCFMFFDDVCVRHNVEKIKTVGDSYMCAGGVPIKNTSNPIDVVLAAFEMIDFISKLKKEQSQQGRTLWKIRIGIHTGPIISGVVGKKKFAYDIWGDTVNTASRLEQASNPNRINISGSTYEMVKDFFECESRGEIPVKHKGVINMYFVKRIKKEFSLDDEGRIPNQIFWENYEKLNIKENGLNRG